MLKPNPEDVVAAVVHAAGGSLIGRVRLQKVFYLLDQLGLNSGFKYDYYHYGPYSADLSSAVDCATAFHRLTEEVSRRASDGAAYSVYRLNVGNAEIPERAFGRLGAKKVAAIVKSLKDQDATVLELAATIHWLKKQEKISDWKPELQKRKGTKTANGRADTAARLLEELKI